jgi:hypothetical protein
MPCWRDLQRGLSFWGIKKSKNIWQRSSGGVIFAARFEKIEADKFLEITPKGKKNWKKIQKKFCWFDKDSYLCNPNQKIGFQKYSKFFERLEATKCKSMIYR